MINSRGAMACPDASARLVRLARLALRDRLDLPAHRDRLDRLDLPAHRDLLVLLVRPVPRVHRANREPLALPVRRGLTVRPVLLVRQVNPELPAWTEKMVAAEAPMVVNRRSLADSTNGPSQHSR
jgi:hypothetical protein